MMERHQHGRLGTAAPQPLRGLAALAAPVVHLVGRP